MESDITISRDINSMFGEAFRNPALLYNFKSRVILYDARRKERKRISFEQRIVTIYSFINFESKCFVNIKSEFDFLILTRDRIHLS
jgi:hypothetical protein